MLSLVRFSLLSPDVFPAAASDVSWLNTASLNLLQPLAIFSSDQQLPSDDLDHRAGGSPIDVRLKDYILFPARALRSARSLLPPSPTLLSSQEATFPSDLPTLRNASQILGSQKQFFSTGLSALVTYLFQGINGYCVENAKFFDTYRRTSCPGFGPYDCSAHNVTETDALQFFSPCCRGPEFVDVPTSPVSEQSPRRRTAFF